MDASNPRLPNRDVLAKISDGNQQMIKWLEDVTALLTALTGSGLPIASLTTAERDALTVEDGVIIYNTTVSTFQGRAGGAWVNFH